MNCASLGTQNFEFFPILPMFIGWPEFKMRYYFVLDCNFCFVMFLDNYLKHPVKFVVLNIS